jgi:hypothetical protein
MNEMLVAHLKRMEPSESYYQSLNLNRARTARIDADTLATTAKHRSKLSSKSFSNIGDLVDAMQYKGGGSSATSRHSRNNEAVGSSALMLASARLREKSSNVLNIQNNNNNNNNSNNSAKAARASKSSSFIYSYNFHKRATAATSINENAVDVNNNSTTAASSSFFNRSSKSRIEDDLRLSTNNDAMTAIKLAAAAHTETVNHKHLKFLNSLNTQLRLDKSSRSLSIVAPSSRADSKLFPSMAVPKVVVSSATSRKQSAGGGGSGSSMFSFNNIKQHFQSK